jgi:predicted DNA-binding transcriptional regulator AlpA
MAREILDMNDVVELLQLTEKSIRKLIAADQLPATKLGAVWRFRKDLILSVFERGVKEGRHEGATARPHG